MDWINGRDYAPLSEDKRASPSNRPPLEPPPGFQLENPRWAEDAEEAEAQAGVAGAAAPAKDLPLENKFDTLALDKE